MAQRPKRPADTNQLARLIVDLATGEKTDALPAEPTGMAELGQRGGRKGGAARAASLTPEQRSEIARKAAAKRWAKD